MKNYLFIIALTGFLISCAKEKTPTSTTTTPTKIVQDSEKVTITMQVWYNNTDSIYYSPSFEPVDYGVNSSAASESGPMNAGFVKPASKITWNYTLFKDNALPGGTSFVYSFWVAEAAPSPSPYDSIILSLYVNGVLHNKNTTNRNSYNGIQDTVTY